MKCLNLISLTAIIISANGFSSTAFANQEISEQISQESSIQTIANVVAQLLGFSTQEITEESSYNQRLVTALKLQSEIQDYNQAGLSSPYLAEKISVIRNKNQNLSEAEAVDLLSVFATNTKK